MRAPQRLLLFLLALSLSCSDDDGTGPDPGPVTEASATIQPRGGSLTVEGENGISLKVAFPRGALLSGTRITLRAIDPPAGVRARFAIDPPGLDLLAPATFTVTLPAGASLGASNGLVFTSGATVHVPAQADPASRTLTASLYQLGFNLPPSTAALTSQALAGENEFIDVDAIECDFIREALDNQILRAQAFSGPFPPDLASPLIQEYRAALLVCQSEDSIAAASSILREIACSNSSSAQNHVLVIATAAELKEKLGLLLSAEALVQLTGADCHVAENKIEDAFVEFVNAYVARINSDDFIASFPTWDSLWRELVPCLEIRALADAFELPGVTGKINTELLPALFARLHDVAVDACENDENNSFLLDFARGGHALNHAITPDPGLPDHTGFTQSQIVEELLTCGSTVTVEARTSQNDVLGTTDVDAGDSGNVRVTDAGRLLIADNTLGFTCNGVVSRAPIRARAEVPGSLPLVSLGNLSGSLTVNVATTLTALPAPGEGELPSNFDIVLERDRAVCGIDEPGTIELARIHVDTQGFVTQMSGAWSGGCPGGPVQGTFRIEILDSGNIAGSFVGSASGDITGHVNGNGTFDASASGTAGSCTWSGVIRLDNGAVSTSGTWSCSDAGCSGEFGGSGSPPGLRRD